MRKQLSLVIQQGNACKCSYFIDDPRALDVLYCEYTNSYIISFKQFHKRMCVSTKHFHITGITYDK